MVCPQTSTTLFVCDKSISTWKIRKYVIKKRNSSISKETHALLDLKKEKQDGYLLGNQLSTAQNNNY